MPKLPPVISLSDTALLNQLWAAGLSIDALVASGEYRFGGNATDDDAKEVTEVKAKTKVGAPMQEGLF